jgi:hypothetical protein
MSTDFRKRLEPMESLDIERQLNLFEKMGVPLTPKDTAPMNNHLARSSLFAPIRRGKRAMHDGSVLSSQGDVEVRYHGKQLDMADQDVLLHALNLAAGKKPAAETPEGEIASEARVGINRKEFLEAIGMAKSGQNYKWLEQAFKRLATGSVEVRKGRLFAIYHLIGNLMYDSEAGDYFFYVPRSTFAFFLENAFGYVNMKRRLALETRVDVAKWIQSFAASHAKGEYAIGVAKLKELCAYESPLRKFREALREALDELVRVGEFARAGIDDNDNAVWVKL